ncbi:MAG: hypothetical protein M3400_11995 [Actinomycetota bacterium]|nr:hypothetical protein [Actinomycetota bacterium]
MPPTRVHFNGGVNLGDAETVMREIANRVNSGVQRIPDGETGPRQQWIFFQLEKFWQTPGLEQAGAKDQPAPGYEQLPKVRLSEGMAPDEVQWPNLGYADAYQESFETFRRHRDEGVLPEAVRFQVQYPTPLASVNAWVVPDDQDRLEPSYEKALFADLDRLLESLPHEDVAVQWDVAVEFAILEESFEAGAGQSFESIVDRLARCIDRVPADVPAGLHLCYGDYQHQHFKQPESLGMQVRIANEVAARAGRTVNWIAFTVPQNRRDAAFFQPLGFLSLPAETELYLALVPYHPDKQEPGTTEEQIRLIDEHLSDRDWGICTECGMARAEPEEVPVLLDLHREILANARA